MNVNESYCHCIFYVLTFLKNNTDFKTQILVLHLLHRYGKPQKVSHIFVQLHKIHLQFRKAVKCLNSSLVWKAFTQHLHTCQNTLWTIQHRWNCLSTDPCPEAAHSYSPFFEVLKPAQNFTELGPRYQPSLKKGFGRLKHEGGILQSKKITDFAFHWCFNVHHKKCEILT